MAVPYTFGNATTSIPLSQLDSNFATAITIGNTAVYLGNTTTSFGNVTLNNVTIASGNATVTKITAPTVDAGSGNALTLQSNSTTAIYVDTSQNVGIGTSSPSTYGKFAVTGAVATTSIDSNGVRLQFSRAGTNYVEATNASGSLSFGTGGADTNRMFIDSSGNVGIGTTSPGSKLQVTGTFNALSVASYPAILSAGGFGGGIGFNDGGTVSGIYTQSTGSQLIFFTGQTSSDTASSKERMRIDSSGNLLVGTTSYTTGKLVIQSKDTGYGGIQLVQYGNTNYWTQNIDSNAGYTWGKNGADFWYAGRSGSNNCVSSNGSWVNSSDSRLKENIEPLQNCLQDICKLQGVSFTRINGGHEEIGLIAQDVEKVFPKAVELPSNETEFYALNYGSLVAPLIEAIKELKAEFDAYKASHP